MKKVIIGLIIGIIFGVSGMFCYDKFIKKEIKSEKANSTTISSKKEELLDIYSDEVQNLYNKIQPAVSCSLMEQSSNSMNLDSYKKAAIYFVLGNLSKDNEKVDSFTYNDLNKTAQQIFGKNFNLENKIYDIPLYKYNEQSESYFYSEEKAFGCTASNPAVTRDLYKAIKSKKNITLYEAVIYSDVMDDQIKYSDPELTKELIECSSGDINESNCHNKSTKYKFVFTLEDNNYILTNVEKA